MKRIGGWVVGAAVILSLLLWVATVAAWGRSMFVEDIFVFQRNDLDSLGFTDVVFRCNTHPD